MARQTKTRRDIYQEVTDRILELLEQGTVPWRNPIKRGAGGGWPVNLDSRKRYRGINVFLLAMRAWDSGFGSDYWVTFKQATKQGGQVKKGEKSSLVVFWKQYDTEDRDTGEAITVPVLRHYNVFNVEQCDGIAAPDAPQADVEAVPFEPLEEAGRIVEGYQNRPQIEHSGSRAFYRPSQDLVQLPQPDRFDIRENYYSTLFHELVHSTGHSKRLNRGLDTELAPFGSPDYSKEELVAEMGAAFLSAAAGISPPTIEQSAAYLDNWTKVLKGDKRLVVTAAAAAQKATDLILGSEFAQVSNVAEHDAGSTVGQAPMPSDQAVDASSPSSHAPVAPKQLELF